MLTAILENLFISLNNPNRYIYQSQNSLEFNKGENKKEYYFSMKTNEKYKLHAVLHYPQVSDLHLKINKLHGLGFNLSSNECTKKVQGECAVIIKDSENANYQIVINRSESMSEKDQANIFIGIVSTSPVTFSNSKTQEVSQ